MSVLLSNHPRSTAAAPARRASAALALTAALLVGQSAIADEPWHEQALELVNQAREAEGLAPLALEDALVGAAEAHAEDMLARDYYDHVSPEGETVRDRYLAAGGDDSRMVSENIAFCEGCPTPPDPERIEAFHDGWMESPEHRENILDPGLATFGFAMASEENVIYGVQTFAGPGRARGLRHGEPEEELPTEALREHALEAVNAARQAEGLATLQPSSDLDAAAEAMVETGRIVEPDVGLRDAVPEEAAANWGALALAAGECGGCGRAPTGTDVNDFLDDWLADSGLRDALLDAEASHLGFALSADGDGRKAAVALTGHAR
jgi:uncharacterized protein YkwD